MKKMSEERVCDKKEEAAVDDKKNWNAPKIERMDILRTMATMGSGADASDSAMP